MNTKLILALSFTFAMLGCASMGGSSMGGDSTVTEATTKQLSGDVPLPPGSTIKQQDTLVMGSGNSWTGRINLSVAGEPQAVFTWFRDSMAAAGWTLTSSSFSKLSLLTFSKGERVGNVQMQATNFGGNEVLVTVSPVTRNAPAAVTR
ncbi:MAG: hypothetical protein V4614_13355 [Pseudomonadota bacterium]